jgi:SPP1 family predicted phage head-tail adaptor
MAKTTPIGAYRHRVTLQRPVAGEDAIGQPAAGFADVASCWASILNVSGAAAIKAGAMVATTGTSVRVRWRTDVQPGWRVLHGTTVYKVRDTLPDEVSRAHVDLVCEVVR